MSDAGSRAGAFTPPDAAQRQQIERQLSRCMLVEAAAGTGKTTSMVARMVALVRSGACADVRQLAAVTFTRKAASELRERFRLALERARLAEPGAEERERLRRASEGLDQGFVGTIHAFCARLLRERPIEAGVDLDFEELDQEQDLQLRQEAWGVFVARELARGDSELQQQLDQVGLRLGQLAPAFSRYVDYPDVEQWPAAEVELGQLEPLVRDLQAYLEHMRQLQPLLPREHGTDTLVTAYRDLPRMAAHHQPLDPQQPRELMQLLRRFNRRQQRYTYWVESGNFTKAQALEEARRWEEMSQRAQAALGLWYAHRYPPVMRALQAAQGAYDQLRAGRGQLNFQDLLLRAARLLRESAHVRRYFARRYTHLLVDEFQDTDPVQAEVLLLLTCQQEQPDDWRRCTPRPGALFVVGDPKQSIYRFRRADIVTYNLVKERIVAAGGEVVQLWTSFRTCPALVRWLNEVFAPRFPAQASDVSPAYVALEPGPQQQSAGPSGVRLLQLPQDAGRTSAQVVAQEAQLVARLVASWIAQRQPLPRTAAELDAGRPAYLTPGDVLIVARRRAHLSAYARALMTLGVPQQVSGGAALNEVPELELLWRCVAVLARPDDPLALLTLLRSELFGFSDVELYAYRSAGGSFDYRRRVPDGLEPEVAEPLEDALERLRHYSRLAAERPLAAALEQMMLDLGLLVRAAARPGGDLEAGSLAKALELLRSDTRSSWSLSSLSATLERLTLGQELHDGARAAPGRRDVVRVMNLHKAKGLEAPVVFLVDPTGAYAHEVQLHVDRAGDATRGYMTVTAERVGPQLPELLARPADWEEVARREQAFLVAEEQRLLYVAATRAGRLLVVTQRERGNGRNPWAAFGPALGAAERLTDPGPVRAVQEQQELLTPQEVKQARDEVDQRARAVLQPTGGATAARSYARWRAGATPMFDPPAPHRLSGDDVGQHGVEWGAVVHLLLQAAMADPESDLDRLARAALAEQGLTEELAPEAGATVRAVMGCALWRRARRARRRLVELPFQVLERDGPHPTVVRGVIDLLFDEGDGWVLVDYKTDELAGRPPEQLVRRYAPQVRLYAEAWSRATGEAVKEMGLLLVRGDCRLLPVTAADD